MAGDGEIRKNEMKPDSKLASKIEGKDFIVTAEYVPPAGTSAAAVEAGAVLRPQGYRYWFPVVIGAQPAAWSGVVCLALIRLPLKAGQVYPYRNVRGFQTALGN